MEATKPLIQTHASAEPSEITQLLRHWAEGKSIDSDQLFVLVYPQWHAVAAGLMRRERNGHLLQPTSVVHELFLKLVQQRKLDFESREHFTALRRG